MKPRKFLRPRDDKQGSRLGVGSLIRGRAFRGPQDGKVSTRPPQGVLPTLAPNKIVNWPFVHKGAMPAKLIYTRETYVALFIQGKEEGFDFMFREYYPALCFFAQRLTNDTPVAEDIVSYAFVKTWKRHYLFTTENSIRSYLYTVVRNDCYKHLEKWRRNNRLIQDLFAREQGNAETDCLHQLVYTEFLRSVYQAFEQLSPQCRRVFDLLYIDGKTVKEIAIELNVSESTVKTQKARGLAIIKKSIQ